MKGKQTEERKPDFYASYTFDSTSHVIFLLLILRWIFFKWLCMQLLMQGFPPKANQDIYGIPLLKDIVIKCIDNNTFIFERLSDCIVCIS